MKKIYLVFGFGFLLLTSCLDTDGKISGTSDFNFDEVSFPEGNYLVQTLGTFNGSMGGLEGADQNCLDELRLRYWKGKENFIQLNSSNVKAFLCDSQSCRKLKAKTTYSVSYSGSSVKGKTFISDKNGSGPGDSEAGPLTNDYWTGRESGLNLEVWPNVPASQTCDGWTSLSEQGQAGTSSFDDQRRWSHYSEECSAYKSLVCLVESSD